METTVGVLDALDEESVGKAISSLTSAASTRSATGLREMALQGLYHWALRRAGDRGEMDRSVRAFLEALASSTRRDAQILPAWMSLLSAGPHSGVGPSPLAVAASLHLAREASQQSFIATKMLVG